MSARRNVRKVRASRRPLFLEVMERRELLATFIVTNNGDTGNGTLRQAITNANSNLGPDLISFDLPANELTITPQTALPALTDSNTQLDATTEPNWAGVPLVVINGSGVLGGTNGITVTGGSSTVKGLVLQGFEDGILLSGAGNNMVQDNYIGTDATGETAVANTDNGIEISSNSNLIGGAGPNLGNVISGNTADGILLNGATSTGNVIQGNLIGVDAKGATAIANTAEGIILNGAVGNQIGGVTPGAGNVVSGNSGIGVVLQGTGPISNTVQGNFIGTDMTGTLPIPNTGGGLSINGAGTNSVGGNSTAAANVISGNGAFGILINGASSINNLIQGNDIGVAVNGTSPLGNSDEGILVNGANNDVIGGGTPALGNIIAFNGKTLSSFGISVLSGQGIEILSNSIFNNVGGGINMSNGSNIVPGTNTTQPPPVLTEVDTGAGNTDITGTLSNSDPNKTYIIQFFSNPNTAPPGQEQGQTLLGSATVQTDTNGNATFTVRLAVTTTVGQFVTATATEQGVENSSTFSAEQAIVQAPLTDLSVTISPSPANTLLLGQSETYTITVTNGGPNDATGVILTSTLDVNSTFVSAIGSGTITFSGGVITDVIGDLAANASDTLTVMVTPIATGLISITSVVTGDQIDPDGTNNMKTASVSVVPAADLDVTLLTGTPNPVALDGTLTYVDTVVNNGPSTATNVELTDTLDSTLDLATLMVTPFNGTFTQTGDQIIFEVGTIPAGSSVTLTFSINTTAVGTVLNTIAVTNATQQDPNPANNSATIMTKVDNAADLSVSVSPSPSPAFIGDDLTYTVTVTNKGPSTASVADFTDTLPASVKYVSSTASQGTQPTETGGVVSSSLGTLAAGASATITIVVTPTLSTTLINTASVNDSDPDEIDPNPANNTTSLPPVLVSPADLALALGVSSNPYVFPGTETYIITLTNKGPAAATSPTIIDTLPSGFTVTAVNGVPMAQNGTLLVIPTSMIGTIQSGATETFTISGTSSVSGQVTNTATVNNPDEIDPDTTNNTASIVTIFNPSDIGVTLAADSQAPMVGDLLEYTASIENFGPAATTNATLTIVLPPSVTYVSATSGVGVVNEANGTVLVTISSLGVLETDTVNIFVVPTQIATLTATATGASANFDPNAANDTATSTVAATNTPGTFALSASSYQVAENGGSVAITITRTNGTLGPVTVDYTTIDGTAKSGINYQGSTSGIVFADGETSATITIPVIDDGVVTPNLNFFFAITSVNDGAILGSPSVANITEINVDRDLVPPTVTNVLPLPNAKGKIDSIVIFFSKPLDPTTASNVANYTLFTAGRDNAKLGTHLLPIDGAFYNASNNSVTLITGALLSVNTFYGLGINGTAGFGITDLSGNLLAGSGTGVAGTSYAMYVGIGNKFSYVDASGNQVSLKVTSGEMLMTRFISGEGDTLQLLGITPHKATITGSVKASHHSSGITTINTLTGLGAFGDVRSSLTTPAFYVAEQVFTPATGPEIIEPALVSTSVPAGPLAKKKKK
jgi:uncharacterized repeat protein (TIGR01451 family)